MDANSSFQQNSSIDTVQENDDAEWPDDTTLYQPHEEQQILMPDMASCLSVRVFLKMAGISYTVEFRPNAEFMSPTGKVPFIKCGRFVVAEMDPIIEFAKEKGVSLSDKLMIEQKSDMMAYMSLVNTVLVNAETYQTWCEPSTIRMSYERYGSVFAFPLNRLLSYYKCKSSKSRLAAVGWLNKTSEQVYEEVDRCCKALSDRLGSSDYFFSSPNELDALLFGHVFTILTTPLPVNRFAATVRAYDNIIAHCQRIDKTYFNYSSHSQPPIS